MITPEKASQDYESAIAALGRIATDPGTSSADRSAARRASADLTFNFLNRIEMEFQALSAQYREFIDSINSILGELQGGTSPADALRSLSNLASAGSQLVGAAVAPGPAGARALRRRSAAVAPAPASASRGVGPLKILCVHGVGHQEKDPRFEAGWSSSVSAGLQPWSLARPFEIEFVAYDHLFARESLNAIDLSAAVFKLTSSGIIHGIGDRFRKPRGLGDISDALRWTAGMVAQWAGNDELRAASRDAVRRHIDAFQPEVILGHSLGSLICYDLFNERAGAALARDRVFVTFGSQIGNPFVREALGGRITAIAPARRWFHLYNSNDRAFAAPLRMRAENFEQVTTEFDIPGPLDHDALAYLGHANTRSTVWRFAARDLADSVSRAMSASLRVLRSQTKLAHRATLAAKPEQRALLIGINEYPDPASRLEGCVNDVFLMSSVLQECGFASEDIRVVLNERATAKGILERIDWLLDGADDGQNRVLFYSGHGAQLPGYGAAEKADRVYECLVSYDFDWSREHAVIDDQFYELYSQLPDDANFLAIFDCCHSGGLTRDGGLRARGLNPPDDIRHRALKWNIELQMWEYRNTPDTTTAGGGKAAARPSGGAKPPLSVRKLGQRSHAKAKLEGSKAYRPILLHACQEKQFSYEYRHGATAYGAFTYSLSQIFRAARDEVKAGRLKKMPTWRQLTERVSRQLKTLDYDQKPVIVCPPRLINKPIPWKTK